MKDVFSLLKTCVMVLVVMWTFLGNDETWDEMMLADELALNASDVDPSVVETITPLSDFEEL